MRLRNRKALKKILSILVLFAAALLGYGQLDRSGDESARNGERNERRRDVTIDEPTSEREDRQFRSASDKVERAGQLEGVGTVIKVLRDDNEGSRHQRFILRRESGQTVLVAHNIDVAPRIPELRPGDGVAFFGEFEPNAKGGVVHWTHHDPAGRHVAGWLKHNGRTYQ